MRALILLACVAACGDDDGLAGGPDARDAVDANLGMDMPAVPTGPALDLAKSSLVAPLPVGAVRPIGW